MTHHAQTPAPLADGSLLMGWHTPAKPSFGFGSAGSAGPPSRREETAIRYSGDGHLITLAPTRSGKGRGVVIPNLLSYPGSVIVFDPKAELYRVTSRRRREMGQRVIRLDPCQVIGPNSDSLNPLDIFTLDNADIETDAQTVASWLAQGNQGAKEPFWDLHGTGLHSALIAHVATTPRGPDHNLEAIRKILMGGDTVYNLAVLLDTYKNMNRMAHDKISSFVQTADITRSGILATALAYIEPFLSPRMSAALGNSTFNLRDVVNGAPLSIYMILPPDKIKSHKALLKMWVGTFLKALTSRKHIPAMRTLLLLDECAQLENFPYLETAITLCAGYGLQCWTFWQDMSQLKTWYPTSWETILNNCAVLQTFGIRNRHMAAQWGDFLETGSEQLFGLTGERQVIHIDGQGEYCCRRPDYLHDPIFAGLFDDNPFYAHQAKQHTPPIRTAGDGQPSLLTAV